jgi:hypothetical protein
VKTRDCNYATIFISSDPSPRRFYKYISILPLRFYPQTPIFTLTPIIPYSLSIFFTNASMTPSLGKLISSNSFAYGVGTSAPVILCAGASR